MKKLKVHVIAEEFVGEANGVTTAILELLSSLEKDDYYELVENPADADIVHAHTIGLKDYHNGLIWFWISCIASIAFFKNGYEKEGLDLLNKIAIKVNKDKTIYEVYTKKGKPMKNLFYRSEEGFAWSAGLFVWAYQELANKDK